MHGLQAYDVVKAYQEQVRRSTNAATLRRPGRSGFFTAFWRRLRGVTVAPEAVAAAAEPRARLISPGSHPAEEFWFNTGRDHDERPAPVGSHADASH